MLRGNVLPLRPLLPFLRILIAGIACSQVALETEDQGYRCLLLLQLSCSDVILGLHFAGAYGLVFVS